MELLCRLHPCGFSLVTTNSKIAILHADHQDKSTLAHQKMKRKKKRSRGGGGGGGQDSHLYVKNFDLSV